MGKRQSGAALKSRLSERTSDGRDLFDELRELQDVQARAWLVANGWPSHAGPLTPDELTAWQRNWRKNN